MELKESEQNNEIACRLLCTFEFNSTLSFQYE